MTATIKTVIERILVTLVLMILSKRWQMEKLKIIKSWYPNEVLSDDEAQQIYDRLLQLFLILYQEGRAIVEKEK